MPATLATIIAVAAALLCAAAAASAGTRQSGIQLTPDSGRYLISKDVPTNDPIQRWAISYNLDDHTVTGSVFPLDGGPPQFVWCTTTDVEQAENPSEATYHLSCQFAQPCESAPCTDAAWGPPIDVSVEGSFLLPTNTQSTLAGNVQPIFTDRCANSPSCHTGATAPDLDPGEAWGETVRVAAPQNPAKFYVDPFDDAGSYLLDKVLGTASAGGPMPATGGPLTAEQIDAIRNWILEGAADN